MITPRMSLFVAAAAMSMGAAAPAPSDEPAVPEKDRIENWTGKSVVIFTPHPDDDTFACGGIMKILAQNKNTVRVVLYTNDNKGTRDLDMTRERLAQIRRAEEESACADLGIPKENLTWLGYEDGDLEYAEPRRLRGEACRLIKKFRPDALFTIDPGAHTLQWHKTDHRMAANITQDAIMASDWHLYYPQHLLDEGLKPFRVPLAYYYYSAQPNYSVDITAVLEDKIKASAKHVSQFEPSLSKYTPEMSAETFKHIHEWGERRSKDGDKYVEKFRRAVEP